MRWLRLGPRWSAYAILAVQKEGVTAARSAWVVLLASHPRARGHVAALSLTCRTSPCAYALRPDDTLARRVAKTAKGTTVGPTVDHVAGRAVGPHTVLVSFVDPPGFNPG